VDLSWGGGHFKVPGVLRKTRNGNLGDAASQAFYVEIINVGVLGSFLKRKLFSHRFQRSKVCFWGMAGWATWWVSLAAKGQEMSWNAKWKVKRSCEVVKKKRPVVPTIPGKFYV